MSDHHTDEPRPSGRRRRHVADWGVGEEIFDRLPGPHFERRPTDHPVPRGTTADGRRTILIEAADVPAEAPAAAAHEEFASRADALRARRAHDELWGGDEPFADRDAAAELAARAEAFEKAFGETTAPPRDVHGTTADRPHNARAPRSREALGTTAGGGTSGAVVRGGQPGRRTVKIGGRPAEFHGPPARARHRPSRTVSERLGPRPDRVAAWAFALGILLILIAVATANAAVPL
jgi:hypothetical protein